MCVGGEEGIGVYVWREGLMGMVCWGWVECGSLLILMRVLSEPMKLVQMTDMLANKDKTDC